MRKQNTMMSTFAKVLILAIAALLALLLPNWVLLVFLPISTWYIWQAGEKVAKLEQRLAALEKPGFRSEEA